MGNVETEQKAPLAPPEGGDSPSASVALNEENLEALLKAVTAPAESAPSVAPPGTAPPAAVSVPLEAAPPPSDSRPAVHPAEWMESATPTESARSAEGIAGERPTAGSPNAAEAHPAKETTKAETGKAAESLPASPVREATPAVPVAEAQPEVVSKLALLSSIKQRRAVSIRPEPANTAPTEPEIVTPAVVLPEMAAIPQNAEISKHVRPGVEDQPPAGDQQAANETQPGHVAQEKIVQEKIRKPEKMALGIEEIQSKAVVSAPRLKERDSSPMGKPAAYTARGASTLFPPVTEDRDSFGKLKSFATSRVGLAAIGGAILAIGMFTYLLVRPGKKQAASAPKPAVMASVQTPSVNIPAPASAAAGKTSEDKPTAEKPSGIPAPTATPRVEDLKKEEKAPAKVEAPQTAKPPVPAASPASPPPVEVSAARTVARAFAPPAARVRPADSTIVDAPPALSSNNPSAPAAVTLPIRIAPLPPPPAPSAPKSSVPRQINVNGNVQATRLVRQVTPAYPALAKATRVKGVVRFRAMIGTDGQIKSLMLLGGPPPLVQAAADAVKQWRYQPTIVNGETVEVVTEIEVAFTL